MQPPEGTEPTPTPVSDPPLQPVAPPQPQTLVPLPGIPIPPWLLAFTAVTGFALLWGLARAGPALQAGIAYERGKRLEAAGNFGEAAQNLKVVKDVYPEADDARIDLASCYINAGQYMDAAREVRYFEGRIVSAEQSSRLDSLAADLDRHWNGESFQEKPVK